MEKVPEKIFQGRYKKLFCTILKLIIFKKILVNKITCFGFLAFNRG